MSVFSVKCLKLMNMTEAIKDPMNVSLKIDWNTTKNPLIPNEEFFNKRKLNLILSFTLHAGWQL